VVPASEKSALLVPVRFVGDLDQEGGTERLYFTEHRPKLDVARVEDLLVLPELFESVCLLLRGELRLGSLLDEIENVGR
jgi:hypothetical protein